MKIEEIYAITPQPDGWRVLPDGKWIKLGNDVKLGDDVTLDNGVTLGNNVKLGDDVKLGNNVTLGDNETSEKLNAEAIEEYKKRAPFHIFDKWVRKSDRRSPFWNSDSIEYAVGKIIFEPNAKISDVQCDIGLHVFRPFFKPNWAGLCENTDDLICIQVKVMSEDICFAGVADFDSKLRVRKLEVLN